MEMELEFDGDDSVSPAQFMTVTANRLTANRLTANNLSPDPATLEDLFTTPEGQELLTYLVKCALPEGTDLVILDANGVTELLRFPGLLGLATEWEHRWLTVSEQRWISACLLAHVNFYDVSVLISVRGDHPSLTADAAEKQIFPLKEAGFFGNLFQDVDGDGISDPEMYACAGRDKAQGVNSAALAARACAEPDPENPGFTRCGFIYVGECGTENNATEWSCASNANDDDAYQDCHPTPRTQETDWDSNAESFPETMTVHVTA